MNPTPTRAKTASADPKPFTHPSVVKARMLDWAHESDHQRSLSRTGVGKALAGGSLAVLGGVVLTRVLTRALSKTRRGSFAQSEGTSVGRTSAVWATLVFATKLLLPHAINAAASTVKRRSPAP